MYKDSELKTRQQIIMQVEREVAQSMYIDPDYVTHLLAHIEDLETRLNDLACAANSVIAPSGFEKNGGDIRRQDLADEITYAFHLLSMGGS